jgi:hypothetical protein
MAASDVNRAALDYAASHALIDVREAMRKVETVYEFLQNHPSDAPGGDPLTLPTTPADAMNPTEVAGRFGYTADEAYRLRFIFENLMQFGIKALLKEGRHITGLD